MKLKSAAQAVILKIKPFSTVPSKDTPMWSHAKEWQEGNLKGLLFYITKSWLCKNRKLHMNSKICNLKPTASPIRAKILQTVVRMLCEVTACSVRSCMCVPNRGSTEVPKRNMGELGQTQRPQIPYMLSPIVVPCTFRIPLLLLKISSPPHSVTEPCMGFRNHWDDSPN